ncbi:MAG: GGDEF domain-containing protein [bacterium]
MQPPAQTFSVLSFLGVLAQLGISLMLIALFMLLRRFVLRRAYFSAWAKAWAAIAVAIVALVVRYILVPSIIGTALEEDHPVVSLLYFAYQMSKGIAYVFFVRGTLMYVRGTSTGAVATRKWWIGAALFALVSTLASPSGLNAMVVWQSAIAVPALGYCAWSFFRLPASRRTAGSVAIGLGFALLTTLWLLYAGAFELMVSGVATPFALRVSGFVALNSYFDLTLNVLLGYAMIVVLMEDAKREFDDAQTELRVTHDQLRRAALYDSLTETLNRHAYSEGVGLDMVRATFGTVVLADLDNLKQVNDRNGHAAGDILLRRCADVFRATLRPYDKLYRWGGDEFLLIVPSARASDVLARLQTALERADPVETGGQREQIRLQVSLGGADYASSEQLSHAIDRADRAMYAEKARRKADPRKIVLGRPPTPTSSPAMR